MKHKLVRTKKVNLTDLVWDKRLYPREDVNSVHINDMVRAMQAGWNPPPIRAGSKGLVISDGVHRWFAHRKVLGDQGAVTVEIVNYQNDAELYEDAMRLNSGHGRKLSSFERTKCVLRGRELGITDEDLAAALQITVGELQNTVTGKTGELVTKGKTYTVALKQTMRHLRGRTITAEQMEANERAHGMAPSFYANQIINLLERDGIDQEDQKLLLTLGRLFRLMREKLNFSPV